MINKKTILFLAGLAFSATLQAQQPAADTVIVKLARTSQLIFTIDDRSDLEILRHFDFQNLFRDILNKLEKNDTSAIVQEPTPQADSSAEATSKDWWKLEEPQDDENDDDEEKEDDDNEEPFWNRSKKWGKTWQSFNIDLGTNNYLSDGKFPDNDNAIYTVRPWGSWYVALNSVQRTRLGGKAFLEWGLGVSWYNFKFEKDNVLALEDNSGIAFTEDLREVDFVKSKLTASYINASLVPVMDFSGHAQKPSLLNTEEPHHSFRIGLGPYVGYRVGSHTKLVYKEEGDRERDKDKNNFYLENFRYGLRLQLGFRFTDLFFNYDLNSLFAEGKGPDLNAFSFGVIF